MPDIPVFSAYVDLYDDPPEGLRVECSKKDYSLLSNAMRAEGLTCGSAVTKIAGTSHIHDWIEFSVSGGAFSTMKTRASDALTATGCTVSEETLSLDDEVHVRLNLANRSVFDK
jgi:hypothetical protein